MTIAGGIGGGVGGYKTITPARRKGLLKTSKIRKQSSIASASEQNMSDLATPLEAVEEIKRGRAMAGRFFNHPVVKDSYAHNQALARRLGVNLPDRPADISDMVTRRVKIGFDTGDNEIATVAHGYYGDPHATMNFQ